MSLILPVYREAGVIADVLAECCEALSTLGPCEIIIVDDASDDGTAEEVEKYILGRCPRPCQGPEAPGPPIQAVLTDAGTAPIRTTDGSRGPRPLAGFGAEPRIFLLPLPTRLGRGASFRAGVERARGRFIGYMDADGQHDPGDIPRAVNCLRNGSDMVCGLRLQRERPLRRRLLTGGFRLLANVLGRRPVADPLCGFKFFRKDVLVSALEQCHESHWNFDQEICEKIIDININITDLPVIFRKSPSLHQSKTYFIKDTWNYLLYFSLRNHSQH